MVIQWPDSQKCPGCAWATPLSSDDDKVISAPAYLCDLIDKCDRQPMEVSLIAAGYEWTCPLCETTNRVPEATEYVKCGLCGIEFVVDTIEHAEG